MAMVTPVSGLNPDVNQIYPIVNSIYKQMTGEIDIQAVDTASLVSMGDALNDMGKLDLYLRTLCRRIGYTIDGYRDYKSQYNDLHRSQLEWGAYVQKLDAEMPDAVDDKTYDIGYMDGQSVDQYIISNPKARQKIFEKEAPYSFFITMSTKMLKEAFLNAGAMQRFISMVFGKVQNKIAVVMEDLGRLCVANFILNVSDGQHYHLVSMYNAVHAADQVTTATAMQNPNFLRYAVGVMNMLSDDLTGMSVLYNSNNRKKFTPKDKQHFYVLSEFMSRLETVVEYAAFNKDSVTAHPNIRVPYWQANAPRNDPDGSATRMKIMGSVKDNKGVHVEKTLENVIGIIFDWDAMGTFRQEEDVLTTPVNARARYYNTFWHEGQLWFNDTDENAVVFFLD